MAWVSNPFTMLCLGDGVGARVWSPFSLLPPLRGPSHFLLCECGDGLLGLPLDSYLCVKSPSDFRHPSISFVLDPAPPNLGSCKCPCSWPPPRGIRKGTYFRFLIAFSDLPPSPSPASW